MKFNPTNKTNRGNLAVETIAILIVIHLLVAIAVPWYWSQSSNARVDTAKSDIQILAQAQRDAAETYGYYLPLQLLDDAAETRSNRTDSMGNESEAIALVDPEGDLLAQSESPALLGDAAESLATWSGPLAQTKRVYLTGEAKSFDVASLEASALRLDYPLDPWGQPYRFYSPLGLVGSRASESTGEALDSDAFSDGRLTTEDDRFDTFAIVSYGPDGQSDSTTETDDDLIYLFEESEKGEEGE